MLREEMMKKNIREINGEETFRMMSEIGDAYFPNMKSIIDNTVFGNKNFTREEIQRAVCMDMYGFTPDMYGFHSNTEKK